MCLWCRLRWLMVYIFLTAGSQSAHRKAITSVRDVGANGLKQIAPNTQHAGSVGGGPHQIPHEEDTQGESHDEEEHVL